MIRDLLPYWPVALFVLNLLTIWIGWSVKAQFASKEEVTMIREGLGRVDKRVDLVERDLQHLPTRDDLHAVRLGLAEVVGELREARADYRSILNLVSRTEQAVARHESIFADAARQKR